MAASKNAKTGVVHGRSQINNNGLGGSMTEGTVV